MLGLKWIYVSKRDHMWSADTKMAKAVQCISLELQKKRASIEEANTPEA